MTRHIRILKNRVSKYPKVLEWLKLISVTGSSQILIQGIGLISGIIILRILPTKEYALYTVSNAMLGTMTVLADGGISAGVMAQGAKVWQDKEKFGSVINTGLELRKIFAIFSLIVTLPILFYLLYNHGASLLFSFLIIISIIPAFYAALSDNIYEISLKLHQDIPRLQKNQLATGIGRFLMISVSIFIFPWTFIAILGNGIPRILANIRLRKMSNEYADVNQKTDPLVRKEILSVVKRMLPGVIYFCVSGQITIFIISVFGNTKSIAQAGALSRIAMLLTIITVLITTLVVPRFARIQNNFRLLLKRYIQILLVLLLISIVVVGIVWLFPSETLWILGKKYANLKSEIVLSTIGSCMALIVGICFNLNTSRGWTINPVLSISVNIISILICVLVINVSTLKGVLLLNILVNLSDVVMFIIYTLFKINSLKHDLQN
jgi:O-antigen/teichoic acid export membrane protein